jgi:hypothetical protein
MWWGDTDQELLFDRENDPLHEHDLLLAGGDQGEQIAMPFRDALAARLREKADQHADPAARYGRRVIPHDWQLELGASVNIWNNRGRH